jgi:hypothetical protein
LIAAALVWSAPTLAAEEATAATDKPNKRAPTEAAAESEDDFGHFTQFGLRAGLLGGYRMVFRYEESPFCRAPDPAKGAKDQQKFCGHSSPLAVDMGLSFGMLDILEPFLWGRLGLTGEAETNTNPLVIIGAGARFYATADSRFKMFIEPAVGFELEGGAGDPDYAVYDNYKKDVVFHIAAGPQIDISRHVGIYGDAGLTTGIFRSIHTTLELQVGVQARYP